MSNRTVNFGVSACLLLIPEVGGYVCSGSFVGECDILSVVAVVVGVDMDRCLDISDNLVPYASTKPLQSQLSKFATKSAPPTTFVHVCTRGLQQRNLVLVENISLRATHGLLHNMHPCLYPNIRPT